MLFMPVLLELVKAIARWFPPPCKSSTGPEQEVSVSYVTILRGLFNMDISDFPFAIIFVFLNHRWTSKDILGVCINWLLKIYRQFENYTVCLYVCL